MLAFARLCSVVSIVLGAFLSSYLLVILGRTGWGATQTSIGSDVIVAFYVLTGVALCASAFAVFKRVGLRIPNIGVLVLLLLTLLFFLGLNVSGYVVDFSACGLRCYWGVGVG